MRINDRVGKNMCTQTIEATRTRVRASTMMHIVSCFHERGDSRRERNGLRDKLSIDGEGRFMMHIVDIGCCAANSVRTTRCLYVWVASPHFFSCRRFFSLYHHEYTLVAPPVAYPFGINPSASSPGSRFHVLRSSRSTLYDWNLFFYSGVVLILSFHCLNG